MTQEKIDKVNKLLENYKVNMIEEDEMKHLEYLMESPKSVADFDLEITPVIAPVVLAQCTPSPSVVLTPPPVDNTSVSCTPDLQPETRLALLKLANFNRKRKLEQSDGNVPKRFDDFCA